ncbi:AraC-type DNA-binding protein [Cupriavidus sp. YR651]|uniref:AraC family transcriptional regulator n=1 Tax=Cupriavidus sp. YR651 TaxID=1855315 RepID=UPI0008847CAD|nr:AraC family transcriptional regulator [Cupriavidus sp. YR651]SDE03688.1 AraC-type DNA-binding protein [Cupriavidus sp. YR651]
MIESSLSAHVILDHLLAVLDIGVNNFTVCDIRSGWGIRFDTCKTASLHYCLAGVGTLAVRGLPPVQLEPHSFVLLPPGVAYCLESASSKPVRLECRTRVRGVPSQESVPTLTAGEGRRGIETACGEIRAGLIDGWDLFTSLGKPLVVRFDDTDGLRDQFVMLLAESVRPRMGSRVLTEALLKQCLVLALRRWMESDLSPLPWMAAMADMRLSRALVAILEQPDVAYTVDSLALIAGMSRSAFAAAFRTAFGQSPMSLVKLVRLRRASELLITTALTVREIAKRVGFSSWSNFSLAFSQLHGMDPSRFRRTFSLIEEG